MFTEDDKKTAEELLNHKRFMDLIHRIFIEKEDKIDHDLIMTKNNEELGELTRADHLAELKIRDRLNRLKKLAGNSKGRKTAVVPT